MLPVLLLAGRPRGAVVQATFLVPELLFEVE